MAETGQEDPMWCAAITSPRAHRRSRGLYGLLLFAALTVWTVFINPPGFVGATGNVTFTESTTSRTIPGCPEPPFAPDCILEGLTLVCVTTTTGLGPGCIGIDNRDVPNVLPCTDCAGCACEVPPFGTPFCVQAGTTNINVNTDTATFLCETHAAPALSPWGLAAGAGLLMLFTAWRIRRRGATGS